MEEARPAASAAAHTNAFIVLIFFYLCSLCLPCVLPLSQICQCLSTDYFNYFEHIFAPPVLPFLVVPEQDPATQTGPKTHPGAAFSMPFCPLNTLNTLKAAISRQGNIAHCGTAGEGYFGHGWHGLH